MLSSCRLSGASVDRICLVCNRTGNMMLSPRPEISADEAVRFTFDGIPAVARAGESIAAALAAGGTLALRRTRRGAPRGLHCGMGSCFDCIVTVDGRTGVRACLEKVGTAWR